MITGKSTRLVDIPDRMREAIKRDKHNITFYAYKEILHFANIVGEKNEIDVENSFCGMVNIIKDIHGNTYSAGGISYLKKFLTVLNENFDTKFNISKSNMKGTLLNTVYEADYDISLFDIPEKFIESQQLSEEIETLQSQGKDAYDINRTGYLHVDSNAAQERIRKRMQQLEDDSVESEGQVVQSSLPQKTQGTGTYKPDVQDVDLVKLAKEDKLYTIEAKDSFGGTALTLPYWLSEPDWSNINKTSCTKRDLGHFAARYGIFLSLKRVHTMKHELLVDKFRELFYDKFTKKVVDQLIKDSEDNKDV